MGPTSISPAASGRHLDLADRRLAHNYHPLPVVASSASGVWVTDVEGRRFLDALAGYSALNFGHGHPRLLDALVRQANRLTLTSRAFHNDQLGPFAEELAQLAGMDAVLPMNTGAEAVESALKVARKWAYQVKSVPADEATIVVARDDFHGRTISIVSFSADEQARQGFGPFTPGFRVVDYADLGALRAAVDETTAAVLIEPIQGEAGVVVPPDGYLRGVRALCDEAGALFIADEVQSGLGRVGTTFACEREGVRPDAYILGKALGGGMVPVSAVVSSREVLGVLRPGEHGSTFGGNPLGAAVGREVVAMLAGGEPQRRARVLGRRLHDGLGALVGHGATAVRGAGLWAGIDISPDVGTGRDVCERLLAYGVLAKETHGQTLRLAPPLVIEEDELDWLVAQIGRVLGA